MGIVKQFAENLPRRNAEFSSGKTTLTKDATYELSVSRFLIRLFGQKAGSRLVQVWIAPFAEAKDFAGLARAFRDSRGNDYDQQVVEALVAFLERHPQLTDPIRMAPQKIKDFSGRLMETLARFNHHQAMARLGDHDNGRENVDLLDFSAMEHLTARRIKGSEVVNETVGVNKKGAPGGKQAEGADEHLSVQDAELIGFGNELDEAARSPDQSPRSRGRAVEPKRTVNDESHMRVVSQGQFFDGAKHAFFINGLDRLSHVLASMMRSIPPIPAYVKIAARVRRRFAQVFVKPIVEMKELLQIAEHVRESDLESAAKAAAAFLAGHLYYPHLKFYDPPKLSPEALKRFESLLGGAALLDAFYPLSGHWSSANILALDWPLLVSLAMAHPFISISAFFAALLPLMAHIKTPVETENQKVPSEDARRMARPIVAEILARMGFAQEGARTSLAQALGPIQAGVEGVAGLSNPVIQAFQTIDEDEMKEALSAEFSRQAPGMKFDPEKIGLIVAELMEGAFTFESAEAVLNAARPQLGDSPLFAVEIPSELNDAGKIKTAVENALKASSGYPEAKNVFIPGTPEQRNMIEGLQIYKNASGASVAEPGDESSIPSVLKGLEGVYTSRTLLLPKGSLGDLLRLLNEFKPDGLLAGFNVMIVDLLSEEVNASPLLSFNDLEEIQEEIRRDVEIIARSQ